MSTHPSEHEERLARLLTGSGDARAALEDTPLAACDACREIVREHTDLAARLDGLGRFERADVRGALAAPPPAPGPADDVLPPLVRAARARRALPRWGLLAAAAAALLFVLWARRSAPPSDPGPRLGGRIQLLRPVGEVGTFLPFEWRAEDPGPGWFRVVVTPVGGDGPPTESGRLRATSWSPGPEVVAGWGTSIQWRVELHSGAGSDDLVESVAEWATLSPPSR